MRKIWNLVCLVGIVATLAFAGMPGQGQEPQAPANPPAEAGPQNPSPQGEGMVEARLQKMSQQLTLTDEQREKIRPILRNEAEELTAVRSNSNLTQGEARRRARRIRRSTHRHIFQILTPEQQHQWQDLQGERRGGGRSAGGPQAPPNPPNPQ
jgi:Spy/CpxP family protein refolding chaperone